MGREVRRVPLDFDWPMNVPWWGFFNPFQAPKCGPCDGSGYSPAAKQIADDWYDFDRTGRRWCDKITQDEVDALVTSDRLIDLTHTWTRKNGWARRTPPVHPMAEQVNEWSRHFIGHDAINRMICIEARCRRLGIEQQCRWCHGAGVIWPSEDIKAMADAWEPINPPRGDGYQLWETVSEGSPISPVFATREAFVDWLVTDGGQDGPHGRAAAERFVEAAWAPSTVIETQPGQAPIIRSGVDAV